MSYSTIFKSCGSSANLRTFTSRVLADLTSIRTNLIAAIADRASAITQIAALVTDYTAGRAEIVKLVTDITAAKADQLTMLSGTFPRTDHGLSIGTSSKKAVKHVAGTIQINGLTITCPSAETAFTATTHDIADGSANSYILSVQSDGTTHTLTIGTPAVGTTPGAAGSVPAGECAIGLVTIAASGAIFDATSDDLDAAHLTVTYTDYTYQSNFAGETEGTLTVTASNPAAVTATAAAAATAATPSAITTVALTDN